MFFSLIVFLKKDRYVKYIRMHARALYTSLSLQSIDFIHQYDIKYGTNINSLPSCVCGQFCVVFLFFSSIVMCIYIYIYIEIKQQSIGFSNSHGINQIQIKLKKTYTYIYITKSLNCYQLNILLYCQYILYTSSSILFQIMRKSYKMAREKHTTSTSQLYQQQ